jgi:hypothetical protein
VRTSGGLCAPEYNFRNFGVTKGLNNLAIRRIYEDPLGFMRVSPENGIFRCDGERFEAFGPERDSVHFGDRVWRRSR